MLYHANAFLNEASACYGLLQELELEDPRWPYFLALLRLDQGDLGSGEVQLERTLNLVPNHLPSLLKLGGARSQSRLGRPPPRPRPRIREFGELERGRGESLRLSRSKTR